MVVSGPGSGKLALYRAVIDYRLAGHSLQETGTQFNITRERVRQIIYTWATQEELDASVAMGGAYGPRAVASKAKNDRHAAERKARVAACPDCRVCGGRPKRLQRNSHGGQQVTCSKECADLWRRERYYLSLEHRKKHRVILAKAILADPARRASQKRWAAKVVANGGEYLTDKFGGPGGRRTPDPPLVLIPVDSPW